MPTTDCTTDAALPDAPGFDCQIGVSGRAPQRTSRPLRGLFFGFAATVTVGLALASWYVGVRIVSADELTAAGPARPGAAVAETVAASRTILARQFFLQVAGLGEKQDAAFMRALEDRGFRASEDRASQEAGRILIGPFSTRDDMERARNELQFRGVLAIEAEHY